MSNLKELPLLKEKMNTPSNPPPSVHVVVQESQIVGGVKTEDDETDTKIDINGNYTFTRQDKLRQAFDISSFNHMSREVSDVEKSVTPTFWVSNRFHVQNLRWTVNGCGVMA